MNAIPPRHFPTEAELEHELQSALTALARIEAVAAQIRCTVEDSAVPPTLADIGALAVYASDWRGLGASIVERAGELLALLPELDGRRRDVAREAA
jgi:hypothetical protein